MTLEKANDPYSAHPHRSGRPGGLGPGGRFVSDGYDTGEPEILGAEMARLKRRAKRIIWLNPMIGWRDYAPVAQGMAAALPHVDLFAPAHNLESLAALEPYLAKL